MTFNDVISRPFRCNVYMDWLNFKMNGGRDIKFDKLFEHIHLRGGNVKIANFYAPEAEDENQRRFYDAIRRSGFKIEYIEEKGRGHSGKFNCDTMMAVDMVAQADGIDAVYLLTNDYDYIHPVRYLRSRGIRTLLIHAERPSNDLRDEVDEWRMFKQLEL